MAKTSVDDPDIAGEAAAVLRTRALRETIDAALREVAHAKRRLELVAMLREEGGFDFDAQKGPGAARADWRRSATWPARASSPD